MAEITTNDSHKTKAGVKRSKRLSTRIDLTPMVDLGFLLITFFIFTSALNEPTVMQLIMPDEKGKGMPIKTSEALTLIPSSNGKVYYYEGMTDDAVLNSTKINGVRQVILNKKNKNNNHIFVIIKPDKNSSYGEAINILDELTITGVDTYAIDDINKKEEKLIQEN